MCNSVLLYLQNFCCFQLDHELHNMYWSVKICILITVEWHLVAPELEFLMKLHCKPHYKNRVSIIKDETHMSYLLTINGGKKWGGKAPKIRHISENSGQQYCEKTLKDMFVWQKIILSCQKSELSLARIIWDFILTDLPKMLITTTHSMVRP